MTCVNCFFSYVEDAENTYTCRKNPPVILEKTRQDDYFGYWPVVRFDDWCGEWKQNSAKQSCS